MALPPERLGDRTESRRRRFSRILVLPLLLWCVGPAMLVAVVVAGVIEGSTDAATDTRSWRWLIPISVATFASGASAGIVGLVLLQQYLLRSRTLRKGRRNALRDLFGPKDFAPSRFARIQLRLFGVRDEDHERVRDCLRSTGPRYRRWSSNGSGDPPTVR